MTLTGPAPGTLYRYAVVSDTDTLSSIPAGARILRWDGRDGAGRDVAAGVYFLSLEAGGARWQGRIVRLR